MSSPEPPVYYELSWSILSTIGIVNVLLGLMVAGITSFSHVVLVPIVVSAAGALANGMCYYAFYASYPIPSQAVASAIADVCWLVQEAGMSFYSYAILTRVLERRDRLVFVSIFWTVVAAVTAVRGVILVERVRYILDGSKDAGLQGIISNLHIGYFVAIAVLESVSAVFLLRRFAAARTTSVQVSTRSMFFSYLMRSTEVRVALLAVVGTTRAITYSFQTTAQSATNTASQVDRFAYTLECMFPMLMMIDILASKVVFSSQVYHNSGSASRRTANHPPPAPKYSKRSAPRDSALFGNELFNGEQRTKTVIEGGERDSSQERIIEEGYGRSDDIGLRNMDPAWSGGGINKTVEVRVTGLAQ